MPELPEEMGSLEEGEFLNPPQHQQQKTEAPHDPIPESSAVVKENKKENQIEELKREIRKKEEQREEIRRQKNNRKEETPTTERTPTPERVSFSTKAASTAASTSASTVAGRKGTQTTPAGETTTAMQ